MTHKKQIIDTSYVEPKKQKFYTIQEVADKMNTSTTKINSYIYKISKIDKEHKIILDAHKLTSDDIEKLELFKELYEDGNDINEIAKYFINDTSNLINKDTNQLSRNLNKFDTQLIAKSMTQEIQNQSEKTRKLIKEDFLQEILNQFKEETTKIAQLGIEVMNQTKEDIDKKLNETNNKLSQMENVLKEKDKELERLYNEKYSKQDEIYRQKLELQKQKYQEDIEKEKNKSWFEKIFKK